MTLITYLSPTNLAQEKEKFFRSSQYNPTFTYCWNGPEANDWVKQNPNLAALCQALNDQDTSRIQQLASEIFDTKLTSEYLDLARKILTMVPEVLPHQPIEHVLTAFQSALANLGLRDYVIDVVDQHGFNFRPAASQKKIVVSKHLNLDFFSIDGEVKHELVHIIRYENGVQNGIPIAENYLPTEEGLATYCQDYAGEAGQSSLFQHAAEYAMTEVALRGSLRDVTEYLLGLGFSKELAWQRAVRHKFGFVDCSTAGDIMKPSMYFYHQQKIKQLSADEKYRLFVGKIGLDRLSLYPEYSGKISLDQLKEMYRWRQT